MASLYDRYILPRFLACACSSPGIMRQRAKVVPLATGRVLELGIGMGLNLGLYDSSQVTEVIGVDPAVALRQMAMAAPRPPGLTVRVATAPYFIAMKLEAFAGRGNSDYMASHDLEDIVSVVDGHANIEREIADSRNDLQEYLADRFGSLLDNDDFVMALPGHLAGDDASQARIPSILIRLRTIARRS